MKVPRQGMIRQCQVGLLCLTLIPVLLSSHHGGGLVEGNAAAASPNGGGGGFGVNPNAGGDSSRHMSSLYTTKNNDWPAGTEPEDWNPDSNLFWTNAELTNHGGSSSSSSTATAPERSGIPRSISPSSSSSSLSSISDPSRESNNNNNNNRWTVYPPWNPSRRINGDGFVLGLFDRIPGEWEMEVKLRTAHGLDTPCRIRQVPGDGNCLFHSISLCLCHAENRTHWDMRSSLPQLYQHSQQLRQQAVACLRGQPHHHYTRGGGNNNNNNHQYHSNDLRRHYQYHPPPDHHQHQHQHNSHHHSNHYTRFSSSTTTTPTPPPPRPIQQQQQQHANHNNKRLVLQGQESVWNRELVEAAARQYGLTSEEYCQDMLQESVWGGGPEIVALANVLKRPIHVYELLVRTVDSHETDDDGKRDGSSNEEEEDEDRLLFPKRYFCLRRMACFGSPKFDQGGKRRALHILSADSRFPDIKPGQQLSDGNHFLAVFPVDYEHDEDDDDNDDNDGQPVGRRKKRLRGGSFFPWGSQNHPPHRRDRPGKHHRSRRRRDEETDDSEDDDDNRNTHYRDVVEEKDGPFRWMGGWWRRRGNFFEQ